MNFQNEIFKDIQGFEGLYQVSTCGRVKSLERMRIGKGGCFIKVKEGILKPGKNNKGYLYVSLCKDGKIKWFFVHRLVAKAFIPNQFNLPQVNHKDENKENNCVENLEWCDYKYNSNYGTRKERLSKIMINNEKKSKKVICIETGIVYLSAMEVQRQTGINRGNVSSCCNGKLKTAGKFHWKYVD